MNRSKYRVAIIREGLNGVMVAGFEPWDVYLQPAERTHHSGGLPRHCVRVWLQLKGHVGVGEWVCGDHPE